MIIAIMLTFCLSVALFQILPISSQEAGEYDPWLDYNDDGKIDMRDIGTTCRAFATTGNPTKNVTVTNWPEADRSLFPELLILRGVEYVFGRTWNFTDGVNYETERHKALIDDDTPYPVAYYWNASYLAAGYPFSTSGHYNYATFTHESYPQSEYQIQGNVIVSFTLEYGLWNQHDFDDKVYFDITVSLHKVRPDGSSTILDSDTLHIIDTVPAYTTMGDLWRILDRRFSVQQPKNIFAQPGVVFSFTSPVTVNAEERLRILIATYSRSEEGLASGHLLIHSEPGTNDFITTVPIVKP